MEVWIIISNTWFMIEHDRPIAYTVYYVTIISIRKKVRWYSRNCVKKEGTKSFIRSIYLRVLYALQLNDDILCLAKDDAIAQAIQYLGLKIRKRASKKKWTMSKFWLYEEISTG